MLTHILKARGIETVGYVWGRIRGNAEIGGCYWEQCLDIIVHSVQLHII